MEKLKYIKINSLELYNKYCNIHEELMQKEDESLLQEIELLEVLIEEYDNRMLKDSYVKLDPVELLRSLMKDAGLGQTEFAKNINISRQLLSDILAYRRNISKELVVKLASFFSMSQEAFSREYSLRLDAKKGQ